MKILILGYSALFKKRIIKVLLDKKIKFCIASKTQPNNEKKAYKWFRDYNYALKNSKADLVYISLPNSNHYSWAKKALEKKYHVIVDKPITLNIKQAKILTSLAKKKNRLLAEATFFNYHDQFQKALKTINGYKNIKIITTNFIIPMPKKKSFRMQKRFAGGCYMDMSPYAAATARLLGFGKLLNIQSNVYKNKQGLITSFNISCKFKNNYYLGNFCFGGEYTNNMLLFSNKKKIEINNVFSPPSNKNLKILIRENNSFKQNKIKKDDIFKNFLNEIMNNLNKKIFKPYYKKILIDAEFRNKIN